MTNPLLVVVAAGPGLGLAVARRFGRDGYDVALVARDEGAAASLSATLVGEGIATTWAGADITDEPALRAAIGRLGEAGGRIDVLHFNPSAFRQLDPLRLTVAELLEDVALGVGGLLTAVQAARPFMTAGGRVLATGSSAADHPWHEAASLGVQKAGLRNLVRSVDATLAPDGIRAVSITVDGILGSSPAFSPESVAEAVHAAARQPVESWQTEVRYEG